MFPAALHLSDAQISALLSQYLWPLFRILGFFMAEPLFSSRSIPRRAKVIMGIMLTIMISPLLPPMPVIPVISGAGLLVLMHQVLIGLAMGYMMRLMLTAVEMAGFFISSQMGLGFAMFFDPQHSGQVPTISRLLSLLVLLLLMAMNGHHLMLSTLIDSFKVFPITADGLPLISYRMLAEWGGQVFSLGLLLSMPVMAALLIANVAMGIMTRAAPQFNVFSFGFPLTITIGFVVLYFMMPYLIGATQMLYQHGTELVLTLIKAKAEP